MSVIRLYLDEDARRQSLLQALRARGVDTISVAEAGMFRRSDEKQLNWALVNNRVLYSFNIIPLLRNHSDFLGEG